MPSVEPFGENLILKDLAVQQGVASEGSEIDVDGNVAQGGVAGCDAVRFRLQRCRLAYPGLAKKRERRLILKGCERHGSLNSACMAGRVA